MLTVGFWASITRDEGRSIRFTLSYEDDPTDVVFGTPAPFDVEQLRRLASAAGYPYKGFAIYPSAEGQLQIWGLSRILPLQRGHDGGRTALRLHWYSAGKVVAQ